MKGLAGKAAIVSGAGSGIGRAIALRLAQEGVGVGILDIRREGAEETAAMIAAAGGRAWVAVCDIADHEAVVAAVRELEKAAGRGTDILVNNAGGDSPGPFLKSTPDQWQQVVATNLFGLLNMSHSVAQGMAQRGDGRIINIASDAGRSGAAGVAVYSACKGAMIAFAKSLARELAKKGVLVNTVCPGPTATPAMLAAIAGEEGKKLFDGLVRAVPLARIGQPEDYPGLVAFLASDDAAYITGQTISVSGGLTMAG